MCRILISTFQGDETNTEASLLITPLAGHDGWQKDYIFKPKR